MSCRNFETILTETARGEMLDARARADALAHAETCDRCAARLADEQALSAGLRAVAAGAAVAQAPARVEAALLAALRQRAASPSGPAVTPMRPDPAPWTAWAIAAAAVILVVSTFAVMRFMTAGAGETNRQAARIVEPTPLASPDESRHEPGDEVVDGGPEILPAPAVDNPIQRLVRDTQFQRGRQGVRRDLMRNARMNGGRINGANSVAVAANAEEEIATDFLPLTYGSNLSQLDDGQVVRVELPRSALHSFGLPVSAERGERVKADVLLGHDGVARAIRFVR